MLRFTCSPIKDSLMSVTTSISGGGGGGGAAGIGGSTGSVDNAMLRADGTGGATVQSSAVTIDDAGAISGLTQLDNDNLRLDGNTISSTDTNGDINLTPNGTGSIVVADGGAGATPKMIFGGSGYGFFRNTVTDGGAIFVALNTAAQFAFKANTIFGMDVNGAIKWSSGSGTPHSSYDTGITRASAGVVAIGTGAAGDFSATIKAAAHTIGATNGATAADTFSTESLTLSTGATTTATSGNLAPANSRIEAILVRVTTTITTAANFTVKVTGGNAFAQIGTATTSNSTLTAGTTYVLVPAAYADQYNATATTLTVTTNANPGAGAVRLTSIYRQFVAPTS